MKKLLSVLVLNLMAVGMFAAITSQATVTVKSVATPIGCGDEIYFYEDADATQLVEDISTGMSEMSVQLYATIDGVNYGSVKQASLVGVKFYFVANKYDPDYTLSFSNLLGEIKFRQTSPAVEGIFTMGEDYAITGCTANQVVEFEIVAAPAPVGNYYTREVASDNWGTICYPELITSVEGADVYEIAGRNADATEIAVVEVAAADMVAGKPYLFNATAAEQKFFYSTESPAEAPVDGACGLTGAFEQTTLGTDGFYVIKGQSFIPALGTSTVLANRAFLAMTDITTMSEYEAHVGVAARFFSVGRGTATDLEGVAAEGMRDGKFIMNGRFVIVKDGKMINVLGL